MQRSLLAAFAISLIGPAALIALALHLAPLNAVLAAEVAAVVGIVLVLFVRMRRGSTPVRRGATHRPILRFVVAGLVVLLAAAMIALGRPPSAFGLPLLALFLTVLVVSGVWEVRQNVRAGEPPLTGRPTNAIGRDRRTAAVAMAATYPLAILFVVLATFGVRPAAVVATLTIAAGAVMLAVLRIMRARGL